MTVDFPIPRACSLVQAALWVTRRQPPISDFTFEAAPLMLEPSEIDPQGPLRLLLLRLRNGDLPAWADFTLFVGEILGEDEKWSARSSVYQIRLPETFWRWSNVQWQDSEIKGIELFHPDFRYFAPEHEPEKFLELQEASKIVKTSGMQQKLIINSITVDARELLNLFPGASNSEHQPSRFHIPTYVSPYVEFLLFASRELNLHPDNRMPKADIAEWIKEHWPDSFGKFSNSKCTYMATFLRDPSDEKGGHFHPRRSK